MDTDQQERFRKAVDRKSEESEAASHQQQPHEQSPDSQGIQGGNQPTTIDTAHTQDELSVRDKSSGKGHKTADKWNQ